MSWMFGGVLKGTFISSTINCESLQNVRLMGRQQLDSQLEPCPSILKRACDTREGEYATTETWSRDLGNVNCSWNVGHGIASTYAIFERFYSIF